jgi:GNAT superfamily N-acetyltransferase
VELRPTAAEDLPALHGVFTAAIGELYGRHGFDPPAPPLEVFVTQHGHVLRHDGDRCWVAEQRGRIAGFVAAIARGDDWFLSSLFVEPTAQAAGTGKVLLEHAWGEFRRRRTLTDAIQPVSNGLYAKRGLLPVTPALHLAGRPAAAAPPGLVAAAPSAEALRRLDLASYGFDRRVDHAYWGGIARCTVWLEAGEPAAYAYVFPGGRIGPVAGRTGADAAAALQAELARIDGEASLVVPGSARELVTAALAAGLRFARVPGLLLLSPGVTAPDSLVISGYTLL